jgi:hypothetical protein
VTFIRKWWMHWFFGASNLFNHHVTSRIWVPGRCDPASFAKTWAHNDSKWNHSLSNTHQAMPVLKTFSFLPAKLHRRVSSELEPHSISGFRKSSIPYEKNSHISWVSLGTFLVNFSSRLQVSKSPMVVCVI